MEALETSELPYETKEFKIAEANDAGEFTGMASVYGVKDLVDDIVVKGAFNRTLNKYGNQITLLWQHQEDKPIGVAELHDTEKGLQIKGKLNLAVQAGKEAYELLKQRAVNGLSIGYDATDWDKDEKSGTRTLKEIRLWEVSVVTFPANQKALISAVKKRHAPPENVVQPVVDTLNEQVVPMSKALDMVKAGLKADTRSADDKQILLSLLELKQEVAPPVEAPRLDATPSGSDDIHSLKELIEEMKRIAGQSEIAQ